MYYQNCLEDIKNAEKNNKIRKTLLEKNDMYWPQFRGHLFNIGTQQRETIFGMEFSIFRQGMCIDSLRTQGIIEVHQKTTKHITLAKNKQRVDSVVADLKLKKIPSHCLYEINTSRITKCPKLASKNYKNKKKKKIY